MACQSEAPSVDSSISAYRDRMLAEHQARAANSTSAARAVPSEPVAEPVAWQSQRGPRSSLMVQPAATTQPAPADVLAEIPDPVDAPRIFELRKEKLQREQAAQQDQRVVRTYERIVAQANEYLKLVARPKQIELSLADCVRRAVENSYTVRYEAHNPAINQTQIVEAEAAFDVEFFLDTSYANLDQATATAFVPGTSDTRTYEGGFRKLLPTGMQTSVSLGQTRSKNSLPREFQEMNPVYSSNFIASLRQPLLRGFGLDVNRAQINIARINFDVSQEQFIQKVRDALLDVESAYWQLSQARRQTVITAETLAQNYVTWQNMVERLDHDATQVEVANAESRYQTQYVAYLERVKLLRDAEDRLKNLLNDPELKLSDDVEIIPIEVPSAAAIVLDQFAEVRAALDRRSEIRAARRQIDAARVNTTVAKNQILPQLDVSFQYEVQGMNDTADNSFDNLTTNRFISYTVGVSFAYSFGERKARAQLRRANLQESQAVVALQQVTDAIVEEVNQTVRTLLVRYEQIPPALLSVNSAERNLRSLQARTQRIDPNYLQTELSAVEQLASTRSTLLQVVTEYNTGVVQLEKAKGTLLDYNNVVVSDVPGR